MTQHWSRRSDAARRAFCDIYIRGSLSDGEPRLNLLSKGGGGAVVAILLPQQKVRVTSGLGLPRGRIGVPLTATAWADPNKRNLHMYMQPGWLASTLQGLRLLLAAVPVAKCGSLRLSMSTCLSESRACSRCAVPSTEELRADAHLSHSLSFVCQCCLVAMPKIQ